MKTLSMISALALAVSAAPAFAFNGTCIDYYGVTHCSGTDSSGQPFDGTSIDHFGVRTYSGD
jgi:hypothetical protein